MDIVNVTYAQNGQSSQTNSIGMREMQEKAYQSRDAQYLLIKAPPASGKSRALMFIALDKLFHTSQRKFLINSSGKLSELLKKSCLFKKNLKICVTKVLFLTKV